MTRSRPSQLSMASGEVSPAIYGRTDYQRNQTGLRAMRGLLPMREGGATRMPGTAYLGRTKDDQPARFLRFVFSENDAAVLEFTPGIMRVWRYGALVMVPGPLASEMAFNWQPEGSVFELVTPYDAAALERLDYVQSGDVIYIADGVQPIQKLSRQALFRWTIEPWELNDGPFRVQNLDEALTVQCSAVTGQIAQWAADEVLSAGATRRFGLRNYELLETSHGNVGLIAPSHSEGDQAYTYQVDDGQGGLEDRFVSWRYLSTRLATGNTTLTAAGGFFTDAHVGTLMRIEPTDFSNIPLWVGNANVNIGDKILYDERIYEITQGSNTGTNPPVHDSGSRRTDASNDTIYRFVSDLVGIVRITQVDGPNTAQAEVLREIPQPAIDDPTYRWSEGAWSDRYGYPAALELFDQRLFAARTKTEPRTVWASAIGIESDFQDTGNADGAFAYIMAGSDSLNEVLWLRAARKGLFIGCLGEVYRAFSNNAGEAIGPLTFDTEMAADSGAARVAPIKGAGYPIYLSADRKRVHEVRFSFEEEAARPLELTLAAAHLGAAGFSEMARQSTPFTYHWMRRDDGDLCALLYDHDEQLLGWALCPLASGACESMVVTPLPNGGADVLTLVVKRTINGVERRFVEQMEMHRVDEASGPAEAFCYLFAARKFVEGNERVRVVDCTGFEGLELHAWTEAGTLGPFTPDAQGEIDLGQDVVSAIVGILDTTQHLETLDIPAAARDGDSMGRRKRINTGTGVRVHFTSQGSIAAIERGPTEGVTQHNPEQLVPEQILAQSADAYGGTIVTDVTTGMAVEVSLRIAPEGAGPFTILSIAPNVEEANA